ncbi:MAG: FAD-dependent monooxygenase [Candidatus Dormibacteraeota bacterium]|nr:FAD-dependent monooxygenase [Candidatus Dormibacteraeota bacterium]
MAKSIGGHAVVLGGSMAGLLTARVLSEAYERVTIVERDAVPEGPLHRRGVPQARHLHALLARGLEVLESLFPGLSAELVAAGACRLDLVADTRAFWSGHRLAQAPSGIGVLGLSRPLLESRIRARVRAMDVVTVLDTCDALGLVTTDDRHTVRGVRVLPREPAAERTLTCDLVVDATGRGSRTPTWLTQLGFPEPRRDRVEVDVRYATRAFRLREGALADDSVIVIGDTPAHPRGGAMFAIEGGRHLCSLAGVLGDAPPIDLSGFLAFAETFAFPDLREALIDAEPLDDGARLSYPADVRVRYEHLARHPAGLLVIGDAICALNPVYGQGMTVAAMEAATLLRLVEAGLPLDPGRYYTEIARTIDVPWDITTAADLSRPGVGGQPSVRLRLIDTYIHRLHAAAERDADLAVAFFRVVGLMDPPSALMRPGRVARVLAGGVRAALTTSRRGAG